MRLIVAVLLLVLALSGCTVQAVPGGDAPPVGREATRPAPGAGVVEPVVARAAPATDSRAGDERTAVRAVDGFWRGWFAEQGARYSPPRVAGGYTGTSGPRCGGQPSVPGNAYFCPSGNFIAWDENLMRAGYTQIGDAWVYLVIAHEWGHAIQAQLPGQLVSQAVELQADCLAGAALQGAVDDGQIRLDPGDDQEIARTLEAVADDYPWTDVSSHGNAAQRIAAFRSGVRGSVEACLPT